MEVHERKGEALRPKGALLRIAQRKGVTPECPSAQELIRHLEVESEEVRRHLATCRSCLWAATDYFNLAVRFDARERWLRAGIPARAASALVTDGIISWEDLSARFSSDLQRIPGVGRKGEAAILAALATHVQQKE